MDLFRSNDTAKDARTPGQRQRQGQGQGQGRTQAQAQTLLLRESADVRQNAAFLQNATFAQTAVLMALLFAAAVAGRAYAVYAQRVQTLLVLPTDGFGDNAGSGSAGLRGFAMTLAGRTEIKLRVPLFLAWKGYACAVALPRHVTPVQRPRAAIRLQAYAENGDGIAVRAPQWIGAVPPGTRLWSVTRRDGSERLHALALYIPLDRTLAKGDVVWAGTQRTP